MIDRKRLQHKVLFGLLSSPWTILPVLGGSTALLGLWASGASSPETMLGSMAAVLGGVGVFLTRLLVGSESLTKSALEELQAESQREAHRRLDGLDYALSRDDDERTNQCLRDLRALVETFRKQDRWSGRINAASAFDLAAGVEDLFNECVRLLEKSLELWDTARKMTTAAARQPFVVQREKLIQDIQDSIAQLGQILAGIDSLDRAGSSTSQLARLRGELAESLAVAKRVDEKMNAWDAGVSEYE